MDLDDSASEFRHGHGVDFPEKVRSACTEILQARSTSSPASLHPLLILCLSLKDTFPQKYFIRCCHLLGVPSLGCLLRWNVKYAQSMVCIVPVGCQIMYTYCHFRS